MSRPKVQINDGEIVEVDSVKIIFEQDDNDQLDQIHLIATYEGVIVDVLKGGEVVRTACMDPDVLAVLTSPN